MLTYFEASALTKILLKEPEAPAADELWVASQAVFTSRLTYVECRAAIAAARRAQRIDDVAYRWARGHLERRWRDVHVVEVTPAVADRAGGLAEAHGLRGMDALHLASGLALGDEVVIVSWDRRVAQAALASGAAVGGVRV